MKYVIVANKHSSQGVASDHTNLESELLDILFDLVNGIRRGEVCVEAYDRALVKLIEAERVAVTPVAEVSG